MELKLWLFLRKHANSSVFQQLVCNPCLTSCQKFYPQSAEACANFYLDVLRSPNTSKKEMNVKWPENAQILPFSLKSEGRYESVVLS